MATIQGAITVATSFQQALTSVPGNIVVPIPQRIAYTVTTGTAADQADTKHTKTYSFAGAPQSIDLTAAVDAFGTVNFARVKSIMVRIQSTTDGQTLILGGAGSNPWTGAFSGTLTVAAGTGTNQGFFILTGPNTTGYAVGSTSKILKLDPGAATFLADVEITGASV